jgi:hypothetical protein
LPFTWSILIKSDWGAIEVAFCYRIKRL